ncbi:MAG TPA: sn-glycerol-1-phosphate dehydrogenase, partial [Spirochaetia bacterium]|nr:sn-glycerol-1-phosphate dehydrogenase [Spirochaetia bacterium]
MDTTKIRDALQAAEDTNEFLIQSGCIAETPAVFRRLFGDAKAVVVADEVTFEAAGRTVGSSLRSENVDSLEPFIFPGKPRLHPDYEHITRLKEFLSMRGAIP